MILQSYCFNGNVVLGKLMRKSQFSNWFICYIACCNTLNASKFQAWPLGKCQIMWSEGASSLPHLQVIRRSIPLKPLEPALGHGQIVRIENHKVGPFLLQLCRRHHPTHQKPRRRHRHFSDHQRMWRPSNCSSEEFRTSWSLNETWRMYVTCT